MTRTLSPAPSPAIGADQDGWRSRGELIMMRQNRDRGGD
jgi:hypothetical protein